MYKFCGLVWPAFFMFARFGKSAFLFYLPLWPVRSGNLKLKHIRQCLVITFTVAMTITTAINIIIITTITVIMTMTTTTAMNMNMAVTMTI